MANPKLIQQILRKHHQAYLSEHRQPHRVIKGIKSQVRCRTSAQGVSYYTCPEDGAEKAIYHSCQDKGCTVCGKKRQQQWLSRQSQRLLNSEHYHIVFTLPHEYLPLWRYNREWFIKAQFDASAETLRTLLEGNNSIKPYKEGRLNATPGFISTLHTWGRSLNLHPHIHILITAGGLSQEGDWKSSEGDYLLPVKQVKALYRGKLQAKIKQLIKSDSLRLPKQQSEQTLKKIHRQAYQKEWSVRIQEKYSHGKGVLIYLSRYLGSHPVKPEQLQVINHGKELLFSYYSHREQTRKQERLRINDFLKRYLQHQPRTGSHSIRYYGLYASQSKHKYQQSQALLGEIKEADVQAVQEALTLSANTVLCDCCQSVMQLSHVVYSHWGLKTPLYKGVLLPQEDIRQITEPIEVVD